MKIRLLLVLPLTLLVASCSLFSSKKPKKKEDPDRLRLVGRVASVPAGSGFALVEAYGSWQVPTGGLLSSSGEQGRAATLTASGEKMGRFAAADIKGGTVLPGDAVFYRPIKEAGSSDASDTEEKPASTPEVPEHSKKEEPEPPKS